MTAIRYPLPVIRLAVLLPLSLGAQTIAITGGRVLPVSGPAIPDGGSATEMLLRAPVAMVGYYGPGENIGVRSRGDVLNKLRALLDDTRFYMQHRADFDRSATRTLAAGRTDLEAMIPVLEGRVP